VLTSRPVKCSVRTPGSAPPPRASSRLRTLAARSTPIYLLLAGHRRLASGNLALMATSYAPTVEGCPEGPTRLDREIRVGVPARRTDGSGRRTAGRWVAPPAVAAVRFSGLRVVGRDSLERDSGRPREFLGALMTPRGPSAGSRQARPLVTRTGLLGVVLLRVQPSSPGRLRQDRPPTKAEPAQHPAYWSLQATARSRPTRSTCPHRWQSTCQSVGARRTAGSGPVFAHHDSVPPVRRELAGSLLARVPAVTAQRLDVLVAEAILAEHHHESGWQGFERR
jgi:hypothetical protein